MIGRLRRAFLAWQVERLELHIDRLKELLDCKLSSCLTSEDRTWINGRIWKKRRKRNRIMLKLGLTNE